MSSVKESSFLHLSARCSLEYCVISSLKQASYVSKERNVLQCIMGLKEITELIRDEFTEFFS
eukprot:14430234-Ditylum_brightwellii.AAC.1